MNENEEIERVKQARREYFRKWRANNKDRVKEYNRRYWQSVAEKQQTANQANSSKT